MTTDYTTNKPLLFEETQKITHWLTWTIMGGTLALISGILTYQLITGGQVGNHPAHNGALIGVLCIYFIPAFSLMFYARFTVLIEHDAIYYGWNVPTKDLNKINLNEIQSWEVIKHRYVGHGYRLTKKYGIVYSTGGNKGLFIIKKSGEKVLLGTLKEDELNEVVKKLGLN